MSTINSSPSYYEREERRRIKELEAQVEALRKTDHLHCAQLTVNNRRLEEKDAEIGRLNAFIGEKDDYIKELQSDLEGQKDWAGDLNRQIENLTAALRTKEGQLEEYIEVVRGKTVKSEELTARNKELGEAFVDLTAAKNNALNELHGSQTQAKELWGKLSDALEQLSTLRELNKRQREAMHGKNLRILELNREKARIEGEYREAVAGREQMERANRVVTHQCEQLRRHIPDVETPLCTKEGCEFRFEIHGDRIRLFPTEGS